MMSEFSSPEKQSKPIAEQVFLNRLPAIECAIEELFLEGENYTRWTSGDPMAAIYASRQERSTLWLDAHGVYEGLTAYVTVTKTLLHSPGKQDGALRYGMYLTEGGPAVTWSGSVVDFIQRGALRAQYLHTARFPYALRIAHLVENAVPVDIAAIRAESKRLTLRSLIHTWTRGLDKVFGYGAGGPDSPQDREDW